MAFENTLLDPKNWFLILLGVVWIVGAILQDFKRREVDNLWNFSLIGFALAYRGFVAIFISDVWYFLFGLIGLGVFFILANLFYYSRIFAGGDAKLLMALGTIIIVSDDFFLNIKITGIFVLLFFLLGSVYALIYSLTMMLQNWKDFKKEFKKQNKKFKKIYLLALIFAIFWTVLAFVIFKTGFVLISLVVMIFPILFSFAKAIEESCLVKTVLPNKLTEGDWLYKDVKIKHKKIKANWDGLTKKDIKLLKKSKKLVTIKQGIPFTPSFILAYIVLLFISYKYRFF